MNTSFYCTEYASGEGARGIRGLPHNSPFILKVYWSCRHVRLAGIGSGGRRLTCLL